MPHCKKRSLRLPPATPGDRVEGYLTIGYNSRGEVIVEVPEGKTGKIAFSPSQARYLASTLLKKAAEAEAYRLSTNPGPGRE